MAVPSSFTSTDQMEDWETEIAHEEELMVDEDDFVHVGSEEPQGEGGETQERPRKQRKTTSEVWDHYSKIGIGADGRSRVQCNYCGDKLVHEKGTGTSPLKRHHERCSKKTKFGNVANMIIDADGKARRMKIEQSVVREKFSRVIIRHDLPFSVVEYEEMRSFLSYLNPEYKNYTRNSAASDVVKTWESEKKKLKMELERVQSRICITSDCWTAISGEGYISLTAHYVDENWSLNSKILSFCDIPPPHTGDALASKIHECLKDWEIEKKIFTLTLDNASANDTMQDILKERLNLDDNLVCGGEFFHVRCCAHILNLIVQDGLKIVGAALSKIRDSVKYVKASKARGIAFQECVEGGDRVVLSLDVPTRWNSTFVMLEKALRYQRAFNRLRVVDQSYRSCPSNEEWARASKICEILKPFERITTLMSGTSYSTSNLYFSNVWKIQRMLSSNTTSPDNHIREMACRMQLKFDKYWEQYSFILAMGAVLDPRMKLKFVKTLYDDLDPFTSEVKLENLKRKMTFVFEEYKKKFPVPVASTEAPSSRHHHTNHGRQDFDEELFVLDDVPDAGDEGKSELVMYWEEPKLKMRDNPDMSVLQYWKDNMYRFGPLAYMAFDVLSIPITTVASESAFSIGSRILNKYRSRLLPKHVQALLCTRSWLFGFSSDEKDIESDDDTTEADE